MRPLVREAEAEQFKVGKTVCGTMNQRGEFVPYPDDYVPPLPVGAAFTVTAIDAERGAVTIEATRPMVEGFARYSADGLSVMFTQPHRWWKRRARRFRMTRKKRRGWA